MYELARDGVISIASPAEEILLNGTPTGGNKEHFIDWRLPNYIKEGLTWLRK